MGHPVPAAECPRTREPLADGRSRSLAVPRLVPWIDAKTTRADHPPPSHCGADAMALTDKRVLILAENDYEDLELWYPKLRLIEAGVRVTVAGPREKVYKSK